MSNPIDVIGLTFGYGVHLENPESALERNQLTTDFLEGIAEYLTPIQLRMIRLKFGFEGEEYSLSKIGDPYNLSVTRVGQIILEGLLNISKDRYTADYHDNLSSDEKIEDEMRIVSDYYYPEHVRREIGIELIPKIINGRNRIKSRLFSIATDPLVVNEVRELAGVQLVVDAFFKDNLEGLFGLRSLSKYRRLPESVRKTAAFNLEITTTSEEKLLSILQDESVPLYLRQKAGLAGLRRFKTTRVCSAVLNFNLPDRARLHALTILALENNDRDANKLIFEIGPDTSTLQEVTGWTYRSCLDYLTFLKETYGKEDLCI